MNIVLFVFLKLLSFSSTSRLCFRDCIGRLLYASLLSQSRLVHHGNNPPPTNAPPSLDLEQSALLQHLPRRPHRPLHHRLVNTSLQHLPRPPQHPDLLRLDIPRRRPRPDPRHDPPPPTHVPTFDDVGEAESEMATAG